MKQLSTVAIATLLLGLFHSTAVAVEVINNRLSLVAQKTAFSPTPVSGGPAGTFTVTATFKNVSADPIVGLFFRVAALTGGNLLLNRSGGAGGAGSTLTVPFAGDYSDRVLSLGESIKIDFIIGLAARAAFQFFVDALGTPLKQVLPADPGEAGKLTLAGIDSDADGIRDDVQRYIALSYQNSEKTRAALSQSAFSMQGFLLDANDKDASLTHALEDTSALDCLIYILGIDGAMGAFGDLRAEVLNTPDRSRAYIKANQQLSGHNFQLTPIDQRKLGCAFDPDSMEN